MFYMCYQVASTIHVYYASFAVGLGTDEDHTGSVACHPPLTYSKQEASGFPA